MADNREDEQGTATKGVRAGQTRTEQGEQSEPIFATSSFVFTSAAQAAARFSGSEPGNIYSRFTNPTVQAFERRLAVLEGAENCYATSSGMAAVLAVCMATLRHGDHVICAHGVFGNTALLFGQQMARFGVEVTFVPLTDNAAWKAALRPETRMLFCETPANPLGQIADIAGLAKIAHDAGCILVVDNTVCTAALQRPLAHGADLIVLSATKYIDGQGRCVGGAVAGNGELIKSVGTVLRTAGMCLSPFNAWTFLKGLETLQLRMRAHSENALALATWLREQPGVKAVYHAGLPDHPQRELALRQQAGGSGLVAFEVDGGREAAWRVIDATSLISITANLGDARTTITHPASTTHGRLTPEAREQAGIREGLVRISVGLEDQEDLRRDLQRGLSRL
jgi:O-succinylhomoserine sulfhydrylase